MVKFNMIGFGWNYSNWRPTKTCVIHRGNVLIPRRDLETGDYLPGLMCPVCGTCYTEDIARGATVIKYHEEKHGEEIIKENKRITRSRQISREGRFVDLRD